MPANDRSDITWAPRVSLHKIRALYLSEARGLCDEELLDEVGTGLYSRCDSILEYTEAVAGRVKCKRCARAGITTVLERRTGKPAELIRCARCGWQIRWRVYLAEAARIKGQLDAGHAKAAFQKYVQAYPQCRRTQDKMLAIDQLIHEFHWEMRGEGKEAEAMRTAGVNLLGGTTTEILELLNGLAYTENTASDLQETRDWWRAQKAIARRGDPPDQ